MHFEAQCHVLTSNPHRLHSYHSDGSKLYLSNREPWNLEAQHRAVNPSIESQSRTNWSWYSSLHWRGSSPWWFCRQPHFHDRVGRQVSPLWTFWLPFVNKWAHRSNHRGYNSLLRVSYSFTLDRSSALGKAWLQSWTSDSCSFQTP